MKVLVAGAAGAVGQTLIPLLVSRGHHVVGTTRSADNFARIEADGAQPALMNGLDRSAVIDAVRGAGPDVIVHQMTALSRTPDFKHFDREFATTNLLRTQGTAYLIAAARESGTRRIVVQSYTGWPGSREGGRIKTEDDPFDTSPARNMRQTLDAIREMEKAVLSLQDLEGVVLRYGSFYGPGTAISPDGEVPQLVRRRKLPIVGSGGGVWSFIHMADVAFATALAAEGGPSGVYNIVDDEPTEVSIWVPELARILGAKPPLHVPEWIARLMIGAPGVLMMTRIPGSSNMKAKQDLKWTLTYPSWRVGFQHEFASQIA